MQFIWKRLCSLKKKRQIGLANALANQISKGPSFYSIFRKSETNVYLPDSSKDFNVKLICEQGYNQYIQ